MTWSVFVFSRELAQKCPVGAQLARFDGKLKAGPLESSANRCHQLQRNNMLVF